MGIEKKTTNITNVLIVLFVVVLFAILIKNYASNILESENQALSQESLDYTNNIAGGVYSHINTSEFDAENAPNDPLADESTDNKNDFSLDFNFGKKSVNKYTKYLYIASSIPEFILADIFGLDNYGFKWLIDLLDWVWRIVISIAIIYFIRGIIR